MDRACLARWSLELTDELFAPALAALGQYWIGRVGQYSSGVDSWCQNRAMHAPSTPPGPVPTQARNPLHGLTLEAILTALVAHYGWEALGQRVPVRCFTSDPSIASSLKFLRKTPWARDKVESLYLFMLRDQRRTGAKPAVK